MGFSPLEGLVMGQRSGDVDPSLVTTMAGRLGRTAQEVVDILNKDSGLQGLAGTADSRWDHEEILYSWDCLL